VACLETSKYNCYVNLIVIVNYIVHKDASLNLNVVVNQGNWIIKERKDNDV